jgi:transmembrane sensor
MNDRTAAAGSPGAEGRRAAIEHEAADWIAARDGEHWSEERQHALDAWLAAATAHRVAYLRLLRTWERADRLQVLRGVPAPARAAASGSQGRAWLPRTRGRRLGGGALATTALAALLVVGGPALLQRGPAGETHATALGQQTLVTLADGSRVTLNTDTRVRASVDERQRRVWLERGEAYFEIAHDAGRPFVVEVGRQQVTVVGTKFSVRRDGERLRVQVLEGRVRVTSASGATALLAAADVADATPSSLQLQHESPQALENRMGWLHGQLRLDGMTLAQAAAEFNRYNRRQLRIVDADTAAIRIGGSFEAGNVDAFARLLRAGFGLQVHEAAEVIEVGAPG